MKITQIALRNFRSGQNLTLDTDASRIYICGLNGVGKSSIKDAIRWTLRGVCQTTDAKGQGWEAVVPAGTTTLSAALVLNESTLERKYSTNGGGRSLQWNGFPASIKDAQDAVYDALRTTPEYLDAVLETDYFLRLHHAEAKSMVLGLLNVRIPYGEESLSLEQVESRYKQAFSGRADAKARLKNFLLPTFVAPAEGMLPKPAEIQALLQTRREELQALIGQAGEATGKRKALQAQLEALQRQPVREVGADVSGEEIASLEAHLHDLEAQAEALSRRTKTVTALPSPSEDKAQLIAVLSEHKPTKGCVLDPNVPCKTAKIVFTNQVKVYRAEMGGAGPAAEPDPEPVHFDYSQVIQTRDTLNRRRAEEQEHATAVRVNTQRQSDIDAITAQLASLPPEPDVDATAIEAARARVHKGEQILDRSRETWRAHDAYHKAKAQYDVLQADVARLEALCDDLGPNGLRVKALGDAIGAFEEAINRTMSLFGWTVKFALDPWGVDINGRTIEAYSESEQFRIGVAIQMAIAVASGLGFLVVDRLDMLDAANRKLVTGMLLRAETIQQVIILATKEPDAKLPSGTGLKAYRLGKNDDGRSVIQEAT